MQSVSSPHPTVDLSTQLYYQLARDQTEAMLRLRRQNTDAIALVIRLNAQYKSMVRTSLSVQGRLMRMQALRQKRKVNDRAANQDAWALHSAERSMLGIVDPDAEPQPGAWPAAAPAANVDRKIKEYVSRDGTESHDAAFET